jgi:hypothetical protein
VGFLQIGDGQSQILAEGAESGMTEEELQLQRMGSVLKHVRGAGPAQAME